MKISRKLKKEIEKDILTAEKEIKEKQREVDYDIRDFTIDHIVLQFHADEFYIPEYQREFVWRDMHRVRFVESVILGLPIPFMFLADTDDGRLEIVDGAQRIQTLEAFLNDDIVLKDLERLPALNGFKFSDLPFSQQRKFKKRALRMIILEDTTTIDVRHEIFKRINTSGERARPSEIRRGGYKGPFMAFVEECADDPLFLELCPISEKMKLRKEGEELVIRFFAYSDRYKKFKHDVAKFLDQFAEEHQNDFQKNQMKKEFKETLDFIRRYFPNGFAKSKNATTTPRVRFEAIAVGVNLALREKPDLIPKSLDWLESKEFIKHTTTHASNSGPRLRARIKFVKDSLLNEK